MINYNELLEGIISGMFIALVSFLIYVLLLGIHSCLSKKFKDNPIVNIILSLLVVGIAFVIFYFAFSVWIYRYTHP